MHFLDCPPSPLPPLRPPFPLLLILHLPDVGVPLKDRRDRHRPGHFSGGNQRHRSNHLLHLEALSNLCKSWGPFVGQIHSQWLLTIKYAKLNYYNS